eukprot:scaffold99559_cov65-Phaeocystis_antarctica.AAC.4
MLETSKLSGWLNAVANCRVGRRACDAGRGVREPGMGQEAGRACGATAAQVACRREGRTGGWGVGP